MKDWSPSTHTPVTNAQPLCALCGLMCPRSMLDQALETGDLPACDRLNQWQSSHSLYHRPISPDELEETIRNVRLDATSLIWLDGCDVRTTKSAVELAKSTGATVHVGQSSGTQTIKRVQASQGWFGTTLSELGARSDCIVTIGDGVLTESPLLANRFFTPYGRTERPHWIHITSDNTQPYPIAHLGSLKPDLELCIERTNWYSWLCQVAAKVNQDAEIQTSDSGSNLPTAASVVAQKLTQSTQIVWVWDVDEMHFDTDELSVRRLLGLVNQIGRDDPGRRSQLLPLDMNLGRVTAEETLMWLTGCSTTAAWKADRWISPARFEGFALDEWQTAFDSIILVSNVAGPRSLPNIKASLVLQTQQSLSPHQIQVAAVGIDCSGHLFRGDKGVVGYFPAIKTTSLPLASTVLELLRSSP